MKILLHGCNGRMGQVITRLSEMEGSDFEIVCGVDRDLNKFENNYPVYGLLEQVPDNIKADALIDFSHHDCIEDILSFGKKTLTPLVICTSGFTQKEQNVIREASETVPILMSANMSLGINLLLALVEKSAPILR